MKCFARAVVMMVKVAGAGIHSRNQLFFSGLAELKNVRHMQSATTKAVV